MHIPEKVRDAEAWSQPGGYDRHVFRLKLWFIAQKDLPEGFNPQLFTSGTTYDASSVPLYNRLVQFESAPPK